MPTLKKSAASGELADASAADGISTIMPISTPSPTSAQPRRASPLPLDQGAELPHLGQRATIGNRIRAAPPPSPAGSRGTWAAVTRVFRVQADRANAEGRVRLRRAARATAAACRRRRRACGRSPADRPEARRSRRSAAPAPPRPAPSLVEEEQFGAEQADSVGALLEGEPDLVERGDVGARPTPSAVGRAPGREAPRAARAARRDLALPLVEADDRRAAGRRPPGPARRRRPCPGRRRRASMPRRPRSRTGCRRRGRGSRRARSCRPARGPSRRRGSCRGRAAGPGSSSRRRGRARAEADRDRRRRRRARRTNLRREVADVDRALAQVARCR